MTTRFAGTFNRRDIAAAYWQFSIDYQIDTTSFRATEKDSHGRRHVNKQDMRPARFGDQFFNLRGYAHLSRNAQRYYDTLCVRFGYLNEEYRGDAFDVERAIALGMAKAFFASAYTGQAEECGQPLSGQIMDQIPDAIDPAAIGAARTLQLQMIGTAGPLATLYEAHSGNLSPEDWGHYAAMQAMGTGVGLGDYDPHFRGHDLVPYIEFGGHSLSKDYFTPTDEDDATDA